jgi:hypothetical protein
MEKRCERCGALPTRNPKDGQIELLDYCEECSKDLCAKCMAKGCCGHVPALSGNEINYGDE